MSGELRYLPTGLGRVAYVRRGTGPSLVLLHGNGHAWHEFEPVLDDLARRFDVVAWDMPGHGASDDLAGPPSIAGYAAALGELIDGLGLKAPALAGTSVGAMIALACANARPDVRAVVLAEVQYRTRAWWDAAWPRVEQLFGQPVQSREEVQLRFVSQVTDLRVGRWNQDRSRVGARGLIEVMAAIRDFDVIAALAALRTPGLMLFGQSGPTVDMAPSVREALLGLRVEVIADAGHFLTIDRPDAFAEAVSAFLASAEEERGG
ncbi:MAG: alpha/beta fold hydrolase [Caulobacteraceae bacterium]|nr:alpha/beta fold hydrolase [Caulobacteraceae bacterium]